ncbi:indolepyruvate ferredoxin oxidoreductase subunit alpha [Desulfotomaculum copahuensis]|uniref:Indolepyruvate oxidoreductase subunit IorA n=1 Tax=Desulfotomaculum copahuensis TaxID=1838280 RepID=A0A1B7LGU3_9FIRM|nr:indolepyruvate ferredoxin oxidoreductase subunit alpha [Desulfotomaculum copahuensis]OAT85304.1 indolepyruvate ferredoxin oxidoreductase subunit alpha [Desulfotomaculum copahuensis]
MKKLMSGNEAIAYGAYQAGVKVGAAYPGTPSTEVMENFATYPGVYAEWSPNEKVALDVGVGAAYAGRRAMVAMKHVGLNVAADSLFYASYTGVNAGLVIINADDPGLHSSQGEQDNRNYARFARIPMVEPADSEEARQYVGVALEISETFDTPVLLRTVTRLAHSKGAVEFDGELQPVAPPAPDPPAYRRDPAKQVMLPANARRRRPVVEERLQKLGEYAEQTTLNRIEPGDPELGIIAAGAAYQYAREVFPGASFLKLGLVYPLPRRLILDFARRVKQVVVVEELDPFLEEQIRLMGVTVRGKDIFPLYGEFSPHLLRQCAAAAGLVTPPPEEEDPRPPLVLPVRPPMLCPGCGHRGIFYVLKQLNVLVTGDIGCYTLGAAPPLGAMHTCGCMGAGIGVSHGIEKAGVQEPRVAVLGDSTFFHSGMPPLVNVLYNRGATTTIVLDNRVTAMTGHQDDPGTGRTLQGGETTEVDIAALARGMGYQRVDVVDPYELDQVTQVVREHLQSAEPSLIIARRPCVLSRREKHPAPVVDADICVNCGTCLELGCSPLTQEEEHVSINVLLCNGCGLCVQVCPTGAIAFNA